MDQEFRRIPTDLIDPPRNPVRLKASETSIDELAESIKEHGLLQPITVFPVNGRFETYFGDRRQQACKLAGLPEIPCIVVDDPGVLSQVIRLTENIQREDMSPIEEAASVKELQDLNNWGLKTLAAHLGKSTQWVRDRLELAVMPPDLQIQVHNKILGLSHALILSKINDELTRKNYTAEAISQGTSVKTLEMWVAMYIQSQLGSEHSPDPAPDPGELPQSAPRKMRCELCEEYYPIPQLRSIVSCAGCLQIIREAKIGPSPSVRHTDPDASGGGDGVGDQGGETAD